MQTCLLTDWMVRCDKCRPPLTLPAASACEGRCDRDAGYGRIAVSWERIKSVVCWWKILSKQGKEQKQGGGGCLRTPNTLAQAFLRRPLEFFPQSLRLQADTSSPLLCFRTQRRSSSVKDGWVEAVFPHHCCCRRCITAALLWRHVRLESLDVD